MSHPPPWCQTSLTTCAAAGLSAFPEEGAATPDAPDSPHLAVVAVQPGRAIFRLRLHPFHLNTHGTAHGGVLALISDMCTTLAVMTLAFEHQEGVSTDHHCAYLAAVEEGRDYVVDAQVVKPGRTLMYTETTTAPWDTPDRVSVKALHTKMLLVQPPPKL